MDQSTETPVPAWWLSREADFQSLLDRVRGGRVQTLATSPGGRPVRCVTYGQPEPHLRGPVNFNSALGARRPDAFVRRSERQRPVLLVLAGVHGHEVEGMIGAASLISLLETGRDIRGVELPTLKQALSSLVTIVIPLANPDGRARVPRDAFVGCTNSEMHRLGQGTRRDGSLYGWPGCKAVHPMTGDVGLLGAYFDDAGVNLMHDEWPNPFSATTSALCRLVRDEAPDLLLNLHSHEHPPTFLPTHYVPMAVKQSTRDFADAYVAQAPAEWSAARRLPGVEPDGVNGPPPSLNLTSMLYHCGAALPLTFESPHGLVEQSPGFDYDAILDVHHVLFRVAAEWLLKVR